MPAPQTPRGRQARRAARAWTVPALLAILVVASGAGLANPARAARRPVPAFQAGLTVYVYGNPADVATRSATILDRLVAMHANSVSLTFFFTQDNWTASAVHTDPNLTTSKANLASFVRAAHERGLAVVLRPLMDEGTLVPDNQWRGSIQPQDRAAWFASYAALAADYAAFADGIGVELFDIGTEFSSLEADVAGWTQVVAAVRRVYSGKITYSYNWDSPAMGQLAGLDFIGVDAFVPLDLPPGAGVAPLALAWASFVAHLDEVEQQARLPVVITEVGARSQAGSYRVPYLWHDDAPVDQRDQADFLGAVCFGRGWDVVAATGARLWDRPSANANAVADVTGGDRLVQTGSTIASGNQTWRPVTDPVTGESGFVAGALVQPHPVYTGMYVWAIDFNQGIAVPADDPGFSPINKLAEQVLSACYQEATAPAGGSVGG